MTEIDLQLRERYKAFDISKKQRRAKPGDGDFTMGSNFFNLSLFRGIDEKDRLTLHPACGGTKKVNID